MTSRYGIGTKGFSPVKGLVEWMYISNYEDGDNLISTDRKRKTNPIKSCERHSAEQKCGVVRSTHKWRILPSDSDVLCASGETSLLRITYYVYGLLVILIWKYGILALQWHLNYCDWVIFSGRNGEFEQNYHCDNEFAECQIEGFEE